MNYRYVLSCLALASAAMPLHATHNRAGEIIYCHVSGYTYSVQIITHTKTSAPADRPELVINWGDGTIDTLVRQTPISFLANDAQRNVYPGSHTYSGPGIFVLSFEDPNRNEGVLNIPNSVAETFCVKSQLIISPVAGGNCSVRFLNSPLQNACYQKLWTHNPVAYDPDGDSLSYALITCEGYGCDPIAGYQYPDQVFSGPDNQFDIDPFSGTLTWDASQLVGEYNIAVRVTEWRQGVKVGWVTRDMQITVKPCPNEPPVIQELADTCVNVGTLLQLSVQATDPDANDDLTISALGAPFVVPTSPATFTAGVPNNPVSGNFSWLADCSHVRIQPYQVVFRAVDDNDTIALEDYSSLFITIVAPAPQNPLAIPNGLSIDLNWDPSVCTNVTGYKVYRRSGPYGFVPDHCEVGVPAYTGYTLLTTLTGLGSTTYTDDEDLTVGNEYCYMVVACFPDGAQSYASEEFCAILDRQVPVITHVSVGQTDPSAGIDTVRWSNAYDLDTLQHPGPYRFELFRGSGLTTPTTLVYTSSLHPFLAHPDTSFLDLDIDTETTGHVYRVDYYGDGGDSLIGASSVASSIFLTLEPNDEQITLHFEPNVPWTNTLYEVYKYNGVDFTQIGSTATNSYVDTGLVNGNSYCYYVKSTGAYSLPEIVSPLINFSQETCGVPVDLTPPCPPELTLDNDCEEPLNTLTWTNPNSSCADDTWLYHIWFTDSLGGPYVLIATITGATDTSFTHAIGSSVAGCYMVTAIDSVGNESGYSNTVCGDNCPEYELPNVFTPNNDGPNDFFVPFPYRGVKKIDLTIFNRWGQVVYTSEDPAIGWNGVHQESNEPVTEGVYFYVCTVTFARLAGDDLKMLKGYVHVLRGTVPNTN